MTISETVYFVTTNDYKWQAFRQVVERRGVTGYHFERLREETIEIQATDNARVAEFSAQWASRRFGCNVLKEDTGIFIKALAGFPGVYIYDIEKQIGAGGILKLLEKVTDRRATWVYSLSYCPRGGEPVTFTAKQKGVISLQEEGEVGLPVDRLFIPEGERESIAKLLISGSYRRNNHHYEEFLDYLLDQDKKVKLASEKC
jgi:XTP/dITP diphosphohydrolase